MSSLLILLYNLTSRLLCVWIWRYRIRCKKINLDRAHEYRGYYNQIRPKGSLIWFHGSSIGECLSLIKLTEVIHQRLPSWSILLSSNTKNSAEVLEKYSFNHFVHVHIPMDHPDWVTKFFDHWQPDVACWVESEFWPMLCLSADKRKIPRILLNGRISQKSFQFYNCLPQLSRLVIGGFTAVRVQNIQQLHYFHTLGATSACIAPNIKDAANPLPYDINALISWRAAVGNRHIWIAASTHEGEELIIGKAHTILQKKYPNALCILIPRHKERTKFITYMLNQEYHLRICIGMDPNVNQTDLQIIDQFGTLGIFYRLSSIVFIGGSLVPVGGHNMREAALLGCALISGIYNNNFPEQTLTYAEVLQTVNSAENLAIAVDNCWSNKQFLSRSCFKARRIALATSEYVLEANLSTLMPYLQQDM